MKASDDGHQSGENNLLGGSGRASDRGCTEESVVELRHRQDRARLWMKPGCAQHFAHGLEGLLTLLQQDNVRHVRGQELGEFVGQPDIAPRSWIAEAKNGDSLFVGDPQCSRRSRN